MDTKDEGQPQPKITVETYRIHYPDESVFDALSVCLRDDRTKPFLYCIKDRNGNTMHRDGEWEYEPRPSNRDDAYLKNTRFEREEALLLATEYVIKAKGSSG